MVRRITLARIESKLPYLLKPHFFLFFTFSKGVPTCFLVRLASVCRNIKFTLPYKIFLAT